VTIDWSQYAHHELTLKEVQQLSKSAKIWGWVDGMYLAGNDDMIALRFANGKNYETVTRELWRRLCSKERLAIDVGTHSGIFTLDAFRAGCKRVLSIEPHPINYARLVMNVRYNGFPTDGLFYGAVGDENKVSALLVKTQLIFVHAAGRMGMHNEKGQELPQRSMRLDTLIPKQMWGEVDVAKIDAENWTLNALKGMGGVLDHKPELILECTEPGMGEFLKPLGYRFWRIWETGKIEEVEDLIPHNPNNNYNGTDEDCRNRFASVRGLPED